LIGEQNVFKKQSVCNESIVCATYVLEVNEKGGMTVVNGCLLAAAKEVYPDKKMRF
jgi:hypothetical protein